MNFEGKVAVVTGGGSGIGLGIVRALAKRGMKLVIADLNETNLKTAEAEINENGGEAFAQICDVSDIEAVQALADATLSRYGQVNVLCNNAGVGLPTPFAQIDLDVWRWIIDVNLWGPINGVQAFLPHIEKAGAGHISSTSSLAGLIAPEFGGAYAAAKHGCIGFMTALERELRSRNSPIHASVLCPAAVKTNISRNSALNQPTNKSVSRQEKVGRDKGQSIQSSLSQGIDPDLVGEQLADAISREKFWVMTHPEMFDELARQMQALVTDQTLTKANIGLG